MNYFEYNTLRRYEIIIIIICVVGVAVLILNTILLILLLSKRKNSGREKYDEQQEVRRTDDHSNDVKDKQPTDNNQVIFEDKKLIVSYAIKNESPEIIERQEKKVNESEVTEKSEDDKSYEVAKIAAEETAAESKSTQNLNNDSENINKDDIVQENEQIIAEAKISTTKSLGDIIIFVLIITGGLFAFYKTSKIEWIVIILISCFGLFLSSVRARNQALSVTKKRVIVKTGALGRKIIDIPIYKIGNVVVTRGIINGKISLKYPLGRLTISGIKNCEEISNAIIKQMNEENKK